MAKKPKESFVSGVYRKEEDAQNIPLPSIQSIFERAKKKRGVQRSFGRPDSMPTPGQVAQTKRMTGERDD